MNNQKVIQRAIAVSLVRDTNDTLILIRKYQPISKNVSYLELLTIIDKLLYNPVFAKEYYSFLIKKKRLNDYNFHNFIGEIITGVTQITTGLFNLKAQKNQKEIQAKNIQAANTQAMMQMMMKEDDKVANKQKQDNNLMIGVVGGMIVFTGFIIFIKKSNK